MIAEKHYYTQVVLVIQEYLGPASERFIRRQTEFHLGKNPESITKKDLHKLAYGIGVALGLLVGDKTVVKRAVEQIEQID